MKIFLASLIKEDCPGKRAKPAFLKIFDYHGYKNQNILKCGGIDFETFFGELFQFHCTEWLQTFYKIYFRGYLDF